MGYVRCKIGWQKYIKDVTEGKAGGGRKKGRPRLKRIDDVKLDLRNGLLGMKRWRTRALDRAEWAS